MSALPPVLARLPISAFPPATAFNPTDIALFTQGSTGSGTGTTRKLLASQMFGAPIPIGDITPNTGAFTALSGLVTATNSPTARTLADRAADWVNVKDFGAVLNGTANDTAAVAAAYVATPNQGSIYVPNGAWNATYPSPVAGKTVLWRMDRVTNGGGNLSSVVPGDVLEWYPGRKAFWKTVNNISQSAYATLEAQLNINAAGGTFGGVASAMRTTAIAGTNTTSAFVWANNTTLTTSSVSADPSSAPQHVAVAGTTIRAAGNAKIWALFGQATDNTGQPSSVSGNMNGLEVDIFANGADDLGGGVGGRQLAQFVYAPAQAGTAPDIHTGLFLGPQSGITANGRLGKGVDVNGNVYRAAFDASTMIPADGTVAAFRMGPGQVIDFSGNGSGTGSNLNQRTLSYVTADTALEYKVGGTTRWSVSDAGVMSASALATGGTTARTLAAMAADVNNVKSFGAVCDGVTDDTSAVQAAINANNGDVVFPPGVCVISSTLVIAKSGVVLRGAGHGGWTDGTLGLVNQNITTLKWAGSPTGTMIQIEPSAASTTNLQNNGVVDIFLSSGVGGCAYGVSAKSTSFGIYDFSGDGFTSALLYTGSVSTLGTGSTDPSDFQNNDIWLQGVSTAAKPGALLICDGYYSAGAKGNTSFNRFHMVRGSVYNSDGIIIKNADNNIFSTVGIGLRGGSGRGVVLQAQPTPGVPRANLFIQCSPGTGGFVAEGTSSNTYASFDNSIISLDKQNAAPDPTVETGASLDWGNNTVPIGFRAWNIRPAASGGSTYTRSDGVMVAEGITTSVAASTTWTLNLAPIMTNGPITVLVTPQSVSVPFYARSDGHTLNITNSDTTNAAVFWYRVEGM